jgi:hypothetical protein
MAESKGLFADVFFESARCDDTKDRITQSDTLRPVAGRILISEKKAAPGLCGEVGEALRPRHGPDKR